MAQPVGLGLSLGELIKRQRAASGISERGGGRGGGRGLSGRGRGRSSAPERVAQTQRSILDRLGPAAHHRGGGASFGAASRAAPHDDRTGYRKARQALLHAFKGLCCR